MSLGMVLIEDAEVYRTAGRVTHISRKLTPFDHMVSLQVFAPLNFPEY